MPKWTEEEDDVLKKYYPTASWEELLKALLNRTKLSIQTRAKLLNVKRRNYYAPYTKEENEIIRNFYQTEEWDRLLELFPNRTMESIITRANRMNIYRESKKWTNQEIKLLLESEEKEDSKQNGKKN